MPRTSSSRMIKNSSPSSLMSLPEYLPNRMRLPTSTSRGTSLPSSRRLPLPTASTSPSWGFSFAESGIYRPPRRASPFSSTRLITTRSYNGRIFMSSGLPALMVLQRFLNRLNLAIFRFPHRVSHLLHDVFKCDAGQTVLDGGFSDGNGHRQRYDSQVVDVRQQ